MIQAFLQRKNIYIPALLVILLGALLRGYSFYFSNLMFNSDGIYYLQQAKALHLGEFDRFTVCYPDPNLYPFLIVPFYWLTGHWVVAAKMTSFVFGTATLIPLYFILRHFFDRRMATATLAFAAFNPFFVKYSSEILRGPVFWFFVSLGLALCVAAFAQKKRWLFFIGSCLAFIFAAWTRVEAIALLVATPVFLLLLGEPHRRIQAFFSYIAPLLVGVVVFLAFIFLADGMIPSRILPREILPAVLSVFDNYNQLRDDVRALGTLPEVSGIASGFFGQCRNLVLWIALGDVLGLFMIMASYPFVLFFLFGFRDVWQKLCEDVKLRYLLLMGVATCLLLIFHEVSYWIMSVRFVALLFLPLLVFFGYGLERFVLVLQEKRKWPRTSILLVVVCCLFVISLPRNMKHYRVDKVIFREIGEFIAEKEDSAEVVKVAGFFKRVHYINTFANLEAETSVCCKKYHIRKHSTASRLVGRIKKHKFNYFVWDEKNCRVDELRALRLAVDRGYVVEMNQWQTKRLGQMVLFEFLYP